MSQKQTQTNDGPDKQTKWVEIARTGSFVDSSGKNVTLTTADLDELAVIDESQRQVPLVLGHPKTDSPAWGWVAQAKRVGESLMATFRDVEPTVQAAIKAKRYVNRSIRRGPDGKLWHVGLLGATQPAIPGMAPITELSGDDGQIITFSAPDSGDQAQPENETETTEEDMGKDTKAPATGGDGDQSTMDQLSQMQAQLDKLTQDVKASTERADQAEAELAALQGNVVRETREARVNKLIAEGKMLPSEKDDVLQLASVFDIVGEVNLSAEGSEKLVRAEDLFWRQYEERQPHDLLQELSAPVSDSGDKTPPVNLAAKM